MGKHQIPLRITIEVDDTPPPAQDGIRVQEVDGGAVLIVPPTVRTQLIQFGWMPPVDGE